MSMADVTVEIAFGSDPTVAVGSTVWTDVTEWVAQQPGGATELVRTQRGKQYELDEFQAGTCQVVLDNRDGRFSPDNTSSPYWPDVKPMRRIRVKASTEAYTDVYGDTYEGVTHAVFSGFVDQWPQQWLSHAAAQVTVTASDGFKVLHNVGLPSSVYALEVAEDGPDHWWRLGEQSGTTAVDHGSDPRDGTYVGSPTRGAASLVEHESDTAVTFDGTNDAVDIPRNGSLPSGDWTLELLISGASATASPQAVFVQGQKERPQFAIYLQTTDDATPGAINLDYGSNRQVVGTTAVTGAGPHHIVVTYDAATTTVTLTVNDSNDGSSNSAPSLSNEAARIGGPFAGQILGSPTESGSSATHLAATLDEFAIYGAVLSSARTTAHNTAIDAPWNGDLSGARVGRALDIADWPTVDRDIDAGETTFQDGTFADDDTVLAFIQRAQRSEYGYFHVGPASDATFIGRQNLLTEARYTTSQATFSDQPSGSQLPYVDLHLDPSSDATVVNDWTVQRKFGAAQNVQDTTSIATYFERSQSRTALMMDTDAEAKAQAEWLLAHTKDPQTRIRRMTLAPEMDDGLWAQVLGRRLMDRVTVNYRTPGGGSTSKEVHIIGIEHRVSKGRWQTDWWLSPADTQGYLILDDATYGTLGSNRLGY